MKSDSPDWKAINELPVSSKRTLKAMREMDAILNLTDPTDSQCRAEAKAVLAHLARPDPPNSIPREVVRRALDETGLNGFYVRWDAPIVPDLESGEDAEVV